MGALLVCLLTFLYILVQYDDLFLRVFSAIWSSIFGFIIMIQAAAVLRS